ncbi:hypothetical protein SCUCBS95973_001300 [Sporothrix curviconia]|uniref:Uncharacterized protein n=1 Tax=Sporothrix curviconia TaxID=1260050 RepID=A0ABP0AXJ0_9PEZI
MVAAYGDPFYNECRAFGSLQESGHADMAIECFGYVLIDEEHERAMVSSKPPPLRAIVKALGTANDGKQNLPRATAGRILEDIFIDWKLFDFSISVTTPHFLTHAALRSATLSPAAKSAVDTELFLASIADYCEFETMQCASNKPPLQKQKLRRYLIHGGKKYALRSKPRHFTFVDLREHDWKSLTSPEHLPSSVEAAGARTKTAAGRVVKSQVKPQSKTSRTNTQAVSRAASTWQVPSQRLKNPRMWWHKDFDEQSSMFLRNCFWAASAMEWRVRDWLFFPTKAGDAGACVLQLTRLMVQGADLHEHKDLVESDKVARFEFDEEFKIGINEDKELEYLLN